MYLKLTHNFTRHEINFNYPPANLFMQEKFSYSLSNPCYYNPIYSVYDLIPSFLPTVDIACGFKCENFFNTMQFLSSLFMSFSMLDYSRSW